MFANDTEEDDGSILNREWALTLILENKVYTWQLSQTRAGFLLEEHFDVESVAKSQRIRVSIYIFIKFSVVRNKIKYK